MTRSRYRIFDGVEGHAPYFLTSTIVEWIPLLGFPPIAQIILDSLSFMRRNRRITLYAYVMMENHLHIVASSENLSKEIGDFKSFTARKIIDSLKEAHHAGILAALKDAKLEHKRDRTYQVWQEGSHPQEVSSVEWMRQKIEYIHYNPVRRGYVDHSTDWRYSSARNYEGLVGLIEVTTEW
jgi:putative transposase